MPWQLASGAKDIEPAVQDQLCVYLTFMTLGEKERRAGLERRVVERRRTMRYNVRTLLIIDGITWVDPEGGERRRGIRRRADREAVATAFVRHASS